MASSRTSESVARRLRSLSQLVEQGQASELTERTLSKVLSHEADVCRTQLIQLESDLAEFESRYGFSSAEFYRRYRAGQTDDRMDFIEWASLVQMTDSLRRRLQALGDDLPA